MANLVENDQEWELGIYQIEKTDPVLGGPDGVTNKPIKQLANRTAYLKRLIEEIEAELEGYAKSDHDHNNTYASKSHTHKDYLVTNQNLAEIKAAGAIDQKAARDNIGAISASDIPSVNLSASDVGAFAERGILTNAINLNSLCKITDSGVYYNDSNSYATVANNYPVAQAGTLFVTKSAYGCQQMYITFQSNEVFIRGLTTSNNGSGPWGAWRQLSPSTHNHDAVYAKVAHTHAWANITGAPTATTSVQGLVKLIDAVNNGSISDAATANSIKMLRDMLIGIPLPWPLATPPSWGLKLNGATFAAATYPILAQRYPSLKLPDMRANVIRGLDDGRGVDASRTLLSEQTDAIQNLVGNINMVNGGFSTSGAFKKNTTNNGHINAPLVGTDPGITFDASLVARTAEETRMRNIAFNYITIAG